MGDTVNDKPDEPTNTTTNPPSTPATPDYNGSIQSMMRKPTNMQDGVSLLAALKNFIKTSGGQNQALSAKVGDWINSLTNYVTDGGNAWKPPPASSWPEGTAPPTTTTTTTPSGSFRDQIKAKLQAAWPTKSKDANWLNQQVEYYAAKQGTEGKDDAYWLNRASGMGASGADAAEAGQWAGGDSSASGGGGFSPYGGPDFTGGQGSPIGSFAYNGPQAGQFTAPQGSGQYTPFNYNGNTGVNGGMTNGDGLGPSGPGPDGRGTVQPQPNNIFRTQGQPGPDGSLAPPTQQNGGDGYVPGQISAPGQLNPQQVDPQQAMMAQAQLVQAGYAPSVAAQMIAMPDKFAATTAADLYADPSYKFRLEQGQGALEANNAAKGLSRTGGAYKGLIDYGQNAASQEFGNVDARRYRNFSGDTQNAFQVGSTNASNALNAGEFNSGQQQQVNLYNAGAGNATNQFNAGAQNSNNQFNAGQRQSAQATNAGNQIAAYNAYQPLAQNAQAQNIANNTAANQQNYLNTYNATNANNAANLAYGNYGLQRQNQFYNQAANTYGLNQGAQNQAFNQSLGAYNANLAGQGQGYNQALGAFNANLGAQGQGYNQALGAFNANVGAQQGYGNFYLGNNGMNFLQSTFPTTVKPV